MFQEHTINAANKTKLLHQTSKVCQKARHYVAFCTFLQLTAPYCLKSLNSPPGWHCGLTQLASRCLYRLKIHPYELTSGCTLPLISATYDFWYILKVVCIWCCYYELFPPFALQSEVSDVIHLALKKPLSTAVFSFPTLCLVFNSENEAHKYSTAHDVMSQLWHYNLFRFSVKSHMKMFM